MGRPGELSFACPDWAARLREGRSLVPDLPLDAGEAERGVKIFDRLRLPDVPGQPPMAEAAGEWFRDIVRVAAGGRGKVGEIFAMVPKKNNKTTGGAAIMVTLTLMNKLPRAELLFVGPTRDVADVAFDQASGMIAADEFLSKRFHVRDHLKSITDRVTRTRLRIKTFDMRVMTGTIPTVVLLDELHVMARNSYASRVLGQIRGGFLPKTETLLIMITTQSDQPPAGVFKTELDYARAVRDGKIAAGARTLPILYEFPEAFQADESQPWKDPRVWGMVNPNLGRSIEIDGLMGLWQAAQQKGAKETQRWASQHLNIQIGLARMDDCWRGADYWERAAEPALDLEELLARAEVATVGIDGGGLDDLLGLAVIGREADTGRWLLWSRAWCQDDVLERRKDIAETLRDFEKAGELVICEDPDRPTQDIDELADLVAQVFEAGLLPERFGVGLDPVGVSAIVDALHDRGLEVEANGGPVCAVTQGYRLSGAVWGMARKLKDGTLRHAGQALMAWSVGNARTELRGNAVLITKQVSGSAKIDPLMAAFDAFMLMSRNPQAARFSYEAGGMFGGAASAEQAAA